MAKFGFIQTIPGEVILDDDFPFEIETNISPPLPNLKEDNQENDELEENIEKYCVREGPYYSTRDPRFLLPGEYYIMDKGDSFEILEDIRRDSQEQFKTDLDENIFKKPRPVSTSQVKSTGKNDDNCSKIKKKQELVKQRESKILKSSNAECSLIESSEKNDENCSKMRKMKKGVRRSSSRLLEKSNAQCSTVESSEKNDENCSKMRKMKKDVRRSSSRLLEKSNAQCSTVESSEKNDENCSKMRKMKIDVRRSSSRLLEKSNAQCSTGPSKKRRTLFCPESFELTADFTKLFDEN